MIQGPWQKKLSVDEYESWISNILELRGSDIRLSLSRDAYDLWQKFAEQVEFDLRDCGEFKHFKDWGGKLAGTAARIAGIFHCVLADITKDTVVSESTMKMALDLASKLADHARQAISTMGYDPSKTAALKILSWIENNKWGEFTARNCFKALQGTFSTMDEIRPGLKKLEEHGYIRLFTEPYKQVGRPKTCYTVNPDLLK